MSISELTVSSDLRMFSHQTKNVFTENNEGQLIDNRSTITLLLYVHACLFLKFTESINNACVFVFLDDITF